MDWDVNFITLNFYISRTKSTKYQSGLGVMNKQCTVLSTRMNHNTTTLILICLIEILIEYIDK